MIEEIVRSQLQRCLQQLLINELSSSDADRDLIRTYFFKADFAKSSEINFRINQSIAQLTQGELAIEQEQLWLNLIANLAVLYADNIELVMLFSAPWSAQQNYALDDAPLSSILPFLASMQAQLCPVQVVNPGVLQALEDAMRDSGLTHDVLTDDATQRVASRCAPDVFERAVTISATQSLKVFERMPTEAAAHYLRKMIFNIYQPSEKNHNIFGLLKEIAALRAESLTVKDVICDKLEFEPGYEQLTQSWHPSSVAMLLQASLMAHHDALQGTVKAIIEWSPIDDRELLWDLFDPFHHNSATPSESCREPDVPPTTSQLGMFGSGLRRIGDSLCAAVVSVSGLQSEQPVSTHTLEGPTLYCTPITDAEFGALCDDIASEKCFTTFCHMMREGLSQLLANDPARIVPYLVFAMQHRCDDQAETSALEQIFADSALLKVLLPQHFFVVAEALPVAADRACAVTDASTADESCFVVQKWHWHKDLLSQPMRAVMLKEFVQEACRHGVSHIMPEETFHDLYECLKRHATRSEDTAQLASPRATP